MKAIILVAGAGTKLRPLTYTQPKALIPIAGKTILSVIVDQLLESGVKDFVFVIGYLGDKIQHYVEKTYPELKVAFVTQTERNGTGHALWLAKDLLKETQETIIVLGDTICDHDLKLVFNSLTSQIGVKKVEDPWEFGVAELDQNDYVIKVVEKPLMPKSNMAMVGIYYVKETPVLLEALDEQLTLQNPDKEGEYHLTSALQRMIEKGVQFQAFRVANWFDCGKKENLLTTNAILLKELDETRSLQQHDIYNNSVIIPPVSIAEGCTISNSIIGPNATIGEFTDITNSIIRYSIIGSYTKLEDVVLHSSIIGNDAFVHGVTQSLNIGDNTEIDLR